MNNSVLLTCLHCFKTVCTDLHKRTSNMTKFCSVFTPNRTWCPPMNFTLPPLKKSYNQFDYIAECYIVMFIAIFGLLGNFLSIIVMNKDKERREMLFLLQILALADSFYLLLCLLRYPTKYFVSINDYYMMQIYVFPFTKTAQTSAVWAMLLVTVDRYIYICEPLKAQQKFTTRGRRIMAFLVFLFAFIYNLPRFFDSCLMAFVDPCTNRKLLSMVYSPTFNKGNIYLNVYVYGLYIVFLYLGPLLTLVILNAKLIGAIRQSRKRHQIPIGGNSNLENRRNGETNATMILVIIIIIFILCETPELLMKLISLLNRHLRFINNKSTIFNTLSTINTILLVANSAVNFIVYVAYGKRFRRIMRQTFCPCHKCEAGCGKDSITEGHSRLPDCKTRLRQDYHNKDSNITHNTVLLHETSAR